jgi:hypothetical protein
VILIEAEVLHVQFFEIIVVADKKVVNNSCSAMARHMGLNPLVYILHC